MFDKVLIANRGEIAVRIMKTCRRLGARTVAVFSEADARSLHALVADQAVAIGPAPAIDSYLAADKIIAAAQGAGCQAIHPGYGFLSENPAFAAAVAKAGLVFIGPPAPAMALMGDKIAAKKLATQAGLPVAPGPLEPVADAAQAAAAAEAIGYPVMLKPAAGGGGKGMRTVAGPAEMAAAFRAAQAEATKAFADGRLFLEKLLVRPRHLEVQLIADRFGQVIAFPERECSIQRRHQKLIEESPSPAVDQALRQRLMTAAVDLARAAAYENAGTVEFMLDAADGFWFLEMNARLQVEHPVTEMVTGLDLVELQLRVAAGERLEPELARARPRGWAIEARICAEDPARHFSPATGMITRYAEPRGQSIRIDSGVQAGSLVSVHYDSLLAKTIAAGATREEARLALIDALNGYHLEGLVTNLVYLNAILNHPAFIRGQLDTDFIPRAMEDPAGLPPPPPQHLHFMAIAAVLVFHERQRLVRASLQPMVTRVGSAPKPEREWDYMAKSDDQVFSLRLLQEQGPRTWTVTVNGENYAVVTPDLEFYRRRLRLSIDGHRHRFLLHADDNNFQVAFSGLDRSIDIYNLREWELLRHMPEPRRLEASNLVTSPMPGLVLEVRVQPGDRVWRGEVLLVIESMKMESSVPSLIDGEVEQVMVAPGQSVETGDPLVKFKKDEGGA